MVEIKRAPYIIQGIRKDLTESASDDKFAFDAKNIRIDATKNGDGSTGDPTLSNQLSIHNEQGNSAITDGTSDIVLEGIPVGAARLDSDLIVFTTDTEYITPIAEQISAIYYRGNTFMLRSFRTAIVNGTLRFLIDITELGSPSVLINSAYPSGGTTIAVNLNFRLTTSVVSGTALATPVTNTYALNRDVSSGQYYIQTEITSSTSFVLFKLEVLVAGFVAGGSVIWTIYPLQYYNSLLANYFELSFLFNNPQIFPTYSGQIDIQSAVAVTEDPTSVMRVIGINAIIKQLNSTTYTAYPNEGYNLAASATCFTYTISTGALASEEALGTVSYGVLYVALASLGTITTSYSLSLSTNRLVIDGNRTTADVSQVLTCSSTPSEGSLVLGRPSSAVTRELFTYSYSEPTISNIIPTTGKAGSATFLFTKGNAIIRGTIEITQMTLPNLGFEYATNVDRGWYIELASPYLIEPGWVMVDNSLSIEDYSYAYFSTRIVLLTKTAMSISYRIVFSAGISVQKYLLEYDSNDEISVDGYVACASGEIFTKGEDFKIDCTNATPGRIFFYYGTSSVLAGIVSYSL